MTRDEVFEIVRRHLADELEVDPEAIAETTRLREDLEADSLDLFTLVQELEDTHGVQLPEDEAAQITTVGEAVDAVLRHLPAAA
ncbi:acyl carrier protein [Patulibacter defluvii]|uniref:acyl carrier protein n=1 Tax=Patulibacter defluvii TaxID=3095358 RepID=UPI002A757B96|nr:acyl carrier protein [Patulibacter sp. DM4]